MVDNCASQGKPKTKSQKDSEDTNDINVDNKNTVTEWICKEG